MYRYLEDLGAPKKWFKSNVDAILKAYGVKHLIQKEDLFLGPSRFFPLPFLLH
jgi:abelson tyrosine-protein kinase 1